MWCAFCCAPLVRKICTPYLSFPFCSLFFLSHLHHILIQSSLCKQNRNAPRLVALGPLRSLPGLCISHLQPFGSHHSPARPYFFFSPSLPGHLVTASLDIYFFISSSSSSPFHILLGFFPPPNSPTPISSFPFAGPFATFASRQLPAAIPVCPPFVDSQRDQNSFFFF